MTAYHFAQGEFSKSVALSEQLLSLARQSQDPADEVVARMILGANKLFSGELAHARDHLEQAWALYDPDRLRPMTAITGIEVGVFLRGYQAIVWWMLGYPDHAWQTAQAMLSQAQALNHPLSLDFAQAFVDPLIIFLIHGSLRAFKIPRLVSSRFPKMTGLSLATTMQSCRDLSRWSWGEKGKALLKCNAASLTCR